MRDLENIYGDEESIKTTFLRYLLFFLSLIISAFFNLIKK